MTKPGFLPREGLYIDPIVVGLRKSIFHPLFTLPCLHLAGRFSSLAPYEKLVQITAVASILLWLNDWLSTKSRNNWVTDDTWDWKKELVVVTGGSGGIGAGIAQRLAALGSRVVVLDIIPLTYQPGMVLIWLLSMFFRGLLISHAENKRILYHKCDLSDEKEIAAICQEIRAEIGDPTVLGQQ